jgi:hypothetical protein
MNGAEKAAAAISRRPPGAELDIDLLATYVIILIIFIDEEGSAP